MTCACCYAKWKDSLPDTERLKVPDFSFIINNNSRMISTPEKKPRDSHGSKTKKEPQEGEGVIVEHVKTEASNRMIPDSEPEIEANVTATRPVNKKLTNKGGFPKAKCKSLRTSKKSLAQISLFSVERKSRLWQRTLDNTMADKSMKVGAGSSTSKRSVDQLNETRCHKESSTLELPKTDCHTVSNTSAQKPCFKITLDDAVPSPKCQFKVSCSDPFDSREADVSSNYRGLVGDLVLYMDCEIYKILLFC